MSLIIPEDILKKADMSANELLTEIAVYLYDKEKLSFGQAKSLSGLDYLTFQKELSKRKVYIKYDIEDLNNDLENLSQFRDKKAS
ncbi:MAG: UPF0175 family protein [Bacteroidota bacterium]